MSAVDKLTASQEVLVPSVCKYLFAFAVCAGNKAFRAVLAVVCPVPPFAIASVPANVIVPAPVIGPPEVVRPVVPPATSTEVTVPPASCAQEVFVPFVCNTRPAFPAWVGNKAFNPAVAVVCPVPPEAIGSALVRLTFCEVSIEMAVPAPEPSANVPVKSPSSFKEVSDVIPAEILLMILPVKVLLAASTAREQL